MMPGCCAATALGCTCCIVWRATADSAHTQPDLEEGMQSLLGGENSSALAAGSNLMQLAGTTVAICQLGALSPSGRCRTFDASADGYGRGEGVVVAVMQPHGPETAHSCAAVLAASAVNQDGRSSSLTAPNGPAQGSLISTALAAAGAAALEVSALSLHGTGTPLGDPIEVGAVAAALGGSGAQPQARPLGLMSNKSCYGHTEGAAGLLGLLLAAGALRMQAAVPIMHLRQLNPHVAAALQGVARRAHVPLQLSGMTCCLSCQMLEPQALPTA